MHICKQPVTVSDLPPELLTKILAHTMASQVPFDLERFLGLRNDCQDESMSGDSQDVHSWSLEKLSLLQREHYRDWLTVNATCRGFKECGTLPFFSEKMLIITPRLLKTLRYDHCKSISASDKAAIFSHARHVIAALPTAILSSDLTMMSMYNAFTAMRVLSVQAFPHDGGDLIVLPSDVASIPTVSNFLISEEPEYLLLTRIVKRLPAPQTLLNSLRAANLHLERMEVDLLLEDGDSYVRLAFLYLGITPRR